MTQSDRKNDILKGLLRLNKILNSNATEERLILYTEKLIEFNYASVKTAIENCAYTCKFFPTLKEIIDMVDPTLSPADESEEIAGAILKAIMQFSRYDPLGAQNFLGPIGWLTVGRMGGWKTICTSDENDLGTLRAQLSRMAKSIINSKGRIESRLSYEWQKETQIALGENKKSNTKLLGNVLKKELN